MRYEWVFMFGALTTAVTWMIRASRKGRDAESADRPYDPNANRGPSGGDQIVGAECAACEKPFMFAKDAKPCPDCPARVHEKCLEDHARSHLPDRPVYR